MKRTMICVASVLLALVLLAAGVAALTTGNLPSAIHEVYLPIIFRQSAAALTTGNLPGGTPISVGITQPADGLLVAYPPGNIPLNGTASIGKGQAVPNTLLVYVLDVSASTLYSAGTTTCNNPNNDGSSNTVLDCEVKAAMTLNQSAIQAGTVGQVGVAVYGGQLVGASTDQSGAPADMSPTGGLQLLTGPGTETSTPGVPDVDVVLASAFVDGGGGVGQFTDVNVGSNGTNFGKGLQAAVQIVNDSSMQNKVIVFMSDGAATTGPGIGSVIVPPDVLIKAFAIGSGATCDGNSIYGTLNGIAAKGTAGSDCTKVTSVADLPDIIPGVIGSQLEKLTLSVNGGPAQDITSYATPALPVPGPASVAYDRGPLSESPLIYEFCVTAIGSDVGGEGSVQQCVEVTVADIHLAPKTESNAVGTSHTVTATVAAGADGGVGGVLVSFKVLSGPNAGKTGSATTNSSGQAPFAYLGDGGPGTDHIQACFTDDLGITVCDDAEKTWVDLYLSPRAADNAMGASHTVTATVGASVGGVSGVLVSFEVISGPNAGTTGTATTNSSGQASFTYTGNGGPGIDHIQACFTDELGHTVCDTVEKTWLGVGLTPKTAVNAVGASHTVTATVGAGAGGGKGGVVVSFEVVSGPNVGTTGTATTNSSGQASFTYTGNGGPGIDHIQACFTDEYGSTVCDDAEKTWLGVGLTPKTAVNAVGASHTVTATVGAGAGGGRGGVVVSFEVVSGPNVGTTGTATTNSSGQASFTYTGNGSPGVDHIQACFTDEHGNTACDDAQKTWLDIGLTPKTALNAVGTSHTVTATVGAGAGGGRGGVVVHFEVISGPNAGTKGTATTNSSGQASFTYPGNGGPGVDHIRACFTDEHGNTACDDAQKTWIDLKLTPKTGVNAVGSSHTVIATLNAGSGGSASGKPITFKVVSGPNAGTTGTVTTDSNGQASFTYTGNGGPGIDHIQACLTDEYGNTACDDAEKTWLGLEVTPLDATNELGTDDKTHTIVATVTAGSGGGMPGVTVTFEIISGPNAGISGSAVTDGAGHASFAYTGKQGLAGMGTDVIQICFSDPLGFMLCKTAEKHWVDTTPPQGACLEGTNPHGEKKPTAKNEDGYYELFAQDAVDPNPMIYVKDPASGTVWGPFSVGTQIKYTEAPGAPPSQEKIGSDQGQAGAVAWHLTGNADGCIYAVDAAGNQSTCDQCLLVPPPPK